MVTREFHLGKVTGSLRRGRDPGLRLKAGELAPKRQVGEEAT